MNSGYYSATKLNFNQMIASMCMFASLEGKCVTARQWSIPTLPNVSKSQFKQCNLE